MRMASLPFPPSNSSHLPIPPLHLSHPHRDVLTVSHWFIHPLQTTTSILHPFLSMLQTPLTQKDKVKRIRTTNFHLNTLLVFMEPGEFPLLLAIVVLAEFMRLPTLGFCPQFFSHSFWVQASHQTERKVHSWRHENGHGRCPLASLCLVGCLAGCWCWLRSPPPPGYSQ